MIFLRSNTNYFFVFLISIFAFSINWFSANTGVMPIDTFAFFDTGYSILNNKLPIRDFWIFTGIVVDYFQSFFFLLFGESWKSYVFHASFINILVSLSFYFFLLKLNLNKFYSLLYTLSFATLCYPVSGTPFAYIHSYIFSLISIFLFCIGLKNKKSTIWYILPFTFFLAFFSMQTPSSYIFLVIVIFLIYFFFKQKNFVNFKALTLSSFFLLIFFFFYFIFTNTPFENFLYQYIFFPLTIGQGRLVSDVDAYVTLSSQFNFGRLIGDFKFIHIFYFPLIFFTLRSFLKKENDFIKILNLIIVLSVLVFLFNQLVTANQIYIFSLIPILASILHLNISKIKSKYIFVFLIIAVYFVTIKFHYRYNVDRKFLDIESVNKKIAINAEILSPKMKHLKWVTPYTDPNEEIEVIKKAIQIIGLDKRKKVLITHYQFLSVILNEDLNLLNRWYLWGNDTHPTETHKHFNFYKKMVNENIKRNEIEVIYILSQENEILFKHVKNYFTAKCFNSKNIFDNKFSYHEIISCKK